MKHGHRLKNCVCVCVCEHVFQQYLRTASSGLHLATNVWLLLYLTVCMCVFVGEDNMNVQFLLWETGKIWMSQRYTKHLCTSVDLCIYLCHKARQKATIYNVLSVVYVYMWLRYDQPLSKPQTHSNVFLGHLRGSRNKLYTELQPKTSEFWGVV